MVLGAAEIGMYYGINNQSGKPTEKQAFDVLDTAWRGGIREIDTAAAYGDSELLIGKYQCLTGNQFAVNTKLPIDIVNNDLKQAFFDSCNRLCTDHINVLFLHSFNQCKDEDLISFLDELKKEGKIDHIGVSVYEPNEMDYVLNSIQKIDTIQIPFNMFDSHRWIDSGLIKKAIDLNVKIYARSVFLQGLFFLSSSDERIINMGGETYLRHIGVIAEKYRIPLAEMAYRYVFDTEGIQEVIIGCQDSDDVKKNLDIQRTGSEVSQEVRDEIDGITKGIPIEMIDPRRW